MYRRVLQCGTSQQEALLPFGSSFLTNCKKEEEECAAAAAGPPLPSFISFILSNRMYTVREWGGRGAALSIHSFLLRAAFFGFRHLNFWIIIIRSGRFFTFFCLAITRKRIWPHRAVILFSFRNAKDLRTVHQWETTINLNTTIYSTMCFLTLRLFTP